MTLRQIGKKADLSLSINAIVVLILAITMLGLGLAFIKGQFGGVANKLGAMTEQIDAGQKAELEGSPDRITFRTTDFEIKRGTNKELFFAVRNNLGSTETFVVNGFACTDAIDAAAKAALVSSTSTKPIVFEGLASKSLADGSSFVFPLVIKVNAGAIPTTYSCALTIINPKAAAQTDPPYAVKELFVKVTS